jgi:hypothetical protein
MLSYLAGIATSFNTAYGKPLINQGHTATGEEEEGMKMKMLKTN